MKKCEIFEEFQGLSLLLKFVGEILNDFHVFQTDVFPRKTNHHEVGGEKTQIYTDGMDKNP